MYEKSVIYQSVPKYKTFWEFELPNHLIFRKGGSIFYLICTQLEQTCRYARMVLHSEYLLYLLLPY
jgi:hypothetical protein